MVTPSWRIQHWSLRWISGSENATGCVYFYNAGHHVVDGGSWKEMKREFRKDDSSLTTQSRNG